MAKATKPVPEGHHTVTPSLTLDGAAKAIDWYKEALGAEEVARVAGPDGRIMHAEIRIGDSLIMVMDPMMGAKEGGCSAERHHASSGPLRADPCAYGAERRSSEREVIADNIGLRPTLVSESRHRFRRIWRPRSHRGDPERP